MAKEVKAGSAYIDVIARLDKLESGMNDAKRQVEKKAKEMESIFSKIKMNVNTSALKMKFDEVVRWRNDLQLKFEKQIKMNMDISTIKKTKTALDAVNSSLSGMNVAQDDVVNRASKWGMIATGVNQSVQALKEFFSQAKQLVGQSINAAASLEVLRSNFKGNAEDLELLNKAVAGTLGEGKLIALSNWATDLKISMKDQAIALSFAEDRADSYGGTIEENFNKIINASEGMGRGLKEIGIETKVYQENLKNLVKEQGVKLDSLDAEAQKTIMTKAVIMSLGLTIEDVMAKQKDQKDLIESAGVSVDEAKIKFGKFIGEGLTPLLRKFDESNKGIKDFITIFVGVGGVIINAIPLIVQLYTAKKIFAGATAISAAAVSTETTAIQANTAAKVANNSVTLGLIGKTGALAAVAIGVYLLTKEINDNTDAIKKNREAANLNVGFGQQYGSNKPSSASGTANLEGFFANRALQNEAVETTKKFATSVFEVRQRINELQAANEGVNITWAQYFKNIAEIEKLQNKFKPRVDYGKAVDPLATNGYSPDLSFIKTGAKHKISGVKKPQLLSDEDIAILDDYERRTESLGQTLSGAFDQGIQAGENMSEVFVHTAEQFGWMILQALEYKAIMAALSFIPGVGGALSWLGIGGRALGGPVGKGIPYKVGERGEELFIPATAGYILPNNMLQSINSSNSVSNVTNYNFSERSIVDKLDTVNKSIQSLNGALSGMSLNLDGKKVAEMVTIRQYASDRGNIKFR